MLLRRLCLVLIGGSAGGVIAAGVFAFLAMIGVFPRLIGKTETKGHIILYETAIILGGTLGNVTDIYKFHLPPFRFAAAVPVFFGLSAGVFVGCLIMSLAETVKTLPVMNRRFCLAVGFQYVILGIAAGKLAGALFYFSRGMGT